MKFLVDAQLPSKMCEIFQIVGFNAIHVDSLTQGDESSDKEISTYADQNNFILVTKDSDLYHSHMIFGQPKKLLLVTTGNLKNKQLFNLIRSNASKIKILFASCSYVELSNDSIIGHEL